MKKMCFHTSKLPESASRIVMTKLLSIEFGGMRLTSFENGLTLMFTRIFFELPTEINSIRGLAVLIIKEVEYITVHNFAPRMFYISPEVMQLK